VNQYTKIIGHPKIGKGTRLCDFVFLLGPAKIGRNCDIQPGTVVWGGGSLEVGDYVSIGPNCTILTGEYLYKKDGVIPSNLGTRTSWTNPSSNLL